MPTVNKNKKSYYFNMAIMMVLSAAIRAVAIVWFIVPFKLAPGGLSGIASILFNIGEEYGLKIFSMVGVTSLVLNVPLLLSALFFVSKRFTITTLVNILLSSLMMTIFELIPYHTNLDQKEDLFLAAVVSGVLIGISVAMLLKYGTSSGGTDIMGTLIQKKFSSTNIAWLIFVFDAVITISSGIVFKDVSIVLYSFISLFLISKTIEVLLNGFSSAISFYVITEKCEELSYEILNKLQRGVTEVKAHGMYTNKEKSMLIVIVRKRQIGPFKKLVKEVDPHSFVFSTVATEVLGQGFSE